MQLDIDGGALFAIRETPGRSLRPVPWHSWWRTDDGTSNAVLYGGVQPLAAICDTRQRKRPPVTPPRDKASTADF